MSSFLPCLDPKQRQFVPVGSTDMGGIVYLEELGYTRPIENPEDLQQSRKKQMQALSIMDKASRKMATDLGITQESAYKKLFASSVKEPNKELGLYLSSGQVLELLNLTHDAVSKMGEGQSVPIAEAYQRAQRADTRSLPQYLEKTAADTLNSLMKSAAQSMSEKLKISVGDAYAEVYAAQLQQASDAFTTKVEVVEDENVNLSLYLSADDLSELMGLQDDRADTIYRSVSLCIRHRIAYPVRLLLSVEANQSTTTINVAPIAFPLKDGQKIKMGVAFDAPVVTVAGYHKPYSTRIGVQAVSEPIAAPVVGYLAEHGTEEIRVGDPDWLDENTQTILGNDLIVEIYAFYFKEATKQDLDEVKKSQVLKMLSAMSSLQRLTGDISTTNSSDSDAEILPSQPEKALVASPSS